MNIDQSQTHYLNSIPSLSYIYWSCTFLHMEVEHKLYSFLLIYIYYFVCHNFIVIIWFENINFIFENQMLCIFSSSFSYSKYTYTSRSPYSVVSVKVKTSSVYLFKIYAFITIFILQGHTWKFAYQPFQVLKYSTIISSINYVRERTSDIWYFE